MKIKENFYGEESIEYYKALARHCEILRGNKKYKLAISTLKYILDEFKLFFGEENIEYAIQLEHLANILS
jgi:hypothetical protein